MSSFLWTMHKRTFSVDINIVLGFQMLPHVTVVFFLPANATSVA